MILEKYRVLKVIGRGGSSIVYLAEHSILGQKRVIKCIKKDNPHCKTYLKEVKFLKNFKCAAVPVLYDYDEDKDNYYIIQEYIEGISLKQFVLNHKKISFQSILQSFIALAEIFEYLHGQKPYPVIYLDLKPEHVIFSNTGIRLLDFGSAVELKDNNVFGRCMGTYGFAAPELINCEAVDERTDIYSYGALLFWCLTGKTVDKISSKSICLYLRNYSERLQYLILKCLEYDPKNRFKSIKELWDELNSLIVSSEEAKTSYRIAVIGSQPRVGVTHFCIELVIYLNQQNKKCLYEEKTDKTVLSVLYENNKGFSEHQGIVCGKNFYGLPKYGQAVELDNFECEITVIDFGCLFINNINEIKEADVCILIGGSKPWEINFTKHLFAHGNDLTNENGVIYVLPQRCIIPDNKKTFIIPYNLNPFKLNQETKDFFWKLGKEIMRNKSRGEAVYENVKQKRIFTNNDRNTRK